jgi:tetratricopeptide (TPR) repeat protein
VDEARIPAAGLTMKCPQCMSSFVVKKAAKTATRKIAVPGKKRLWIKRPSGKIFGPFLRKAVAKMVKLDKVGEGDVVSVDKQNWVPVNEYATLDEGPQAQDPDAGSKMTLFGTGPMMEPRRAESTTPPKRKEPSKPAAAPPPPDDEPVIAPLPIEDPEEPAAAPPRRKPKPPPKPVAEHPPPGDDLAPIQIREQAAPPPSEDLSATILSPPPRDVSGAVLTPPPEAQELDLDALDQEVGIPESEDDLSDLPDAISQLAAMPGADLTDTSTSQEDLSNLPVPNIDLSELPESEDQGIRLPEPHDGLGDLPAPKGPSTPEPGLPRPPTPKKAKPAEKDIGNLPAPKQAASSAGKPMFADLPAPKAKPARKRKPEVADLPAPKAKPAGKPMFADPPAPKAATPPRVPDIGDLPAPKRPGDIGDLPAPKRPGDIGDLPAPKRPGDISDLPQPKRPGDISDLPEPKGGITDLLQPKRPGDISDLPEPKGGISDLPEPKGGISDLPEPKGGISDLPEPRDGITGLPKPRENIDLLEPKGGISDLPKPSDGVDLPEPLGGISDLPKPSGLRGNFEYGNVELEEGDDVTPLEDLPVPAGQSVGGDTEISFSPPEEEASLTFEPGAAPGASEGVVLDAPPDIDDVPLEELEAVIEGAEEGFLEDVAPVPKKKAKREPMSKRQRALVLGGGFGGFLLLGLAVGIFTDYGVFGLHYLTGGYAEEQKARGMVKNAHRQFGQDTFTIYQQAARECADAAKVLEDEPEPLAMRVQCLSALAVRFGDAGPVKTEGQGLLHKIVEMEPEDASVIPATRGLLEVANGRPAEGISLLRQAAGKHVMDYRFPLYIGWAQLKLKRHKEAATSFGQALSLSPNLPAALYGKALALKGMRQTKPMQLYVERTLKANPQHTGALLLRAAKLREDGKAKEAQAILNRVANSREAPVEKAQAQVDMGRILLASGSTNDARKHFEAAIRINARSSSAHVGMGLIFFNSKYYKKALERFVQAKALAPDNVEAAIMEARTMLAMGNAPEARTALQAVARFAENSHEYPFYLGRVEAELKQYKKAEEQYETAIKRKPTYFEPYLHLSRLYLQLKQPDEALKVLDRAAAKLPNSTRVVNAQGEVYYHVRQLKKAQLKFEEALQLEPNNNAAMFNLANTFHELGNFERAREQYLALKKRDSQYPGLAARLGMLYLKTKQYDLAAEQYEAAIKVDQPSLDLRLAAARAFTLASQFDKALKQSEMALKENASLAEARALRAEALLAKNKADEAFVEIQQALGREEKAEYYFVLGRVFEARGDVVGAIDAYGKALKMDPTRLEIQGRRAILMVQQGQVKDGLRSLAKVAEANPDRAELYYYMGEAYSALRAEDRAMSAYTTAVDKDPAMGIAHLKLAEMQNDRRKFSAAMSHIKLAIKHAKESDRWRPRAYFLEGRVAERLGRRREAIGAYQTYLEIAPKAAAMRPEAEKRLTSLGAPPKEDELP